MPEVWEQEGHVRAGAFLRGDFQEELKSYASTPRTRQGCRVGGGAESRRSESANHSENRTPFYSGSLWAAPKQGRTRAPPHAVVEVTRLRAADLFDKRTCPN